jgi:hypothetical protein
MTDDVHTADPVIFIVHVVLQVILHTEETGMAHLGIRHMMTGVMDEIGQCLPFIEGGIGQCLLIIGGIGLSPHMAGGIGLSPLTVGESGHYPLTVGESGHYPLTKGESGHCLHMIGGMATQDVNDQCLLKILRTGVLTDLEIDICCNL